MAQDHVLEHLYQVILSRRGADPTQSNTAKLFAKGKKKIAQKLGEEAVETVIAAVENDRGHLIAESADLLFHLLVLLKARGVKLVDEQARPGAGGALVAFIHPSAAHGVLVELKQPATLPLQTAPKSLAWGDFQLTSVNDGGIRLDGGAMFSVVPKPLWEKKLPNDDRNRVQLSMRPLVVQSHWGTLIIDCGAGDKWDAKLRDIYGLDRTRTLDHALADAGLSAESIDEVLATHLHFDHFGGATTPQLTPRFPRARYLIRAAEWEDATHPHERNRASYVQHDFVPLKDAGVVFFYEEDREIHPGIRVARTGGHTGQHQIVFIKSGEQTAVFTADMIPTVAHIQDPWIMGYDLFPMETLAFKRRFIREAIDREYLIFFEHDPLVSAGYIREKNNKRYVEQVL